MNALPSPRLTPAAFLVRFAFGAAISGALLAPAWADEGADSGDGMHVVVVNGQNTQDAYELKRTSTATKTDSVLRDIPQSITVIPQALIKDLAMQSMADVARYVPGIGMANGEGNRDSPIFRGSASASGDFYMDGVRDDVEYYRDLYNVERVDALTGPNAMIFGRGGSGGIINRVPKQADWDSFREADLTLGSYGNRRLTLDVGQAVNDSAAVRVTGLLEDSASYQRNFKLRRSGINPTLALRLGQASKAVVGFEHVEDRRTTDRGIPSYQGRPLDTAVSAFFGDPNPDTRPATLRADAFSATLEHEFGDGISLSNKTRYTDYDKAYQNYNVTGLNMASGKVTLAAYNNHQWRKNTFNQTDIIIKLDNNGIKHTVLVGMELGRQDTDYLRKTGVFSNGKTSIDVPLAAPDGTLPVNYVLGGSNSDRDGNSLAKVFGVYAQDQIAISEQWQLIAGLRLDRFTLDYRNNIPQGTLALLPGPATLASRDQLLSPRLGLLYKPAAAATLYANYSVASFPRGGDQLSSLSTVNQGLAPEKFINLELGAKWEIGANLMATAALYRLNRNNVAVVNPVTGVADQLVDGQRSNGLELGIGGNISKHWSIKGGYAYQEAKLLAKASATALAGATVGMVPKQSFSLWNRYDVTHDLGLGLGVISRSTMFTSTSNSVVLPGATRIDAAVFYTVNPNLKLQLNVENLLDKKYYAYANGDNNITIASPRALKLGVHGAF
ncbi:MAG: TonB-dependent siderophore receptor [Pseudomonadota bacterium]